MVGYASQEMRQTRNYQAEKMAADQKNIIDATSNLTNYRIIDVATNRMSLDSTLCLHCTKLLLYAR
ncbi:MAG: hypothetical protein A4E65_02028 [Syntrophorhabdus sp. PtaU1.Bin153]|nr:MAG: hypothetical protein A4E65_02028 [Syntrophorhabdus sp. PtaU1.Bin153]